MFTQMGTWISYTNKTATSVTSLQILFCLYAWDSGLKINLYNVDEIHIQVNAWALDIFFDKF